MILKATVHTAMRGEHKTQASAEVLIHGGVNRLQVDHKGFQVLAGHILAGRTQLVEVLSRVMRKNNSVTYEVG